mmetsp:Transcript_13480/g.18248  ORF Transcript_13480/g.18248 Transcript_13480/m.18248 type:complete len:120 (-) Transcript_13480:387-746(-)
MAALPLFEFSLFVSPLSMHRSSTSCYFLYHSSSLRCHKMLRSMEVLLCSLHCLPLLLTGGTMSHSSSSLLSLIMHRSSVSIHLLPPLFDPLWLCFTLLSPDNASIPRSTVFLFCRHFSA